MGIRKATPADIDSVETIFDQIHTAEEGGQLTIGWARGVYPTRETALAALEREDLFVQEAEGQIIGAGIINQIQVDVYAGADWRYHAPDDQVMVLHTLVISPAVARKGYGQQFVAFYEDYARRQNCPCLRIDTNLRNAAAQAMYKKLDYREADIAPCVFNGIDGVQLVLLEKWLGES